MIVEFSKEEARVIGCLMEKAVTTPDQYPLSLNALTNACNQKSSRDPVMNMQQGEVQRVCRELKEKHLIGIDSGFKSNTEKYTQRFCNTLLTEYHLDSAEYAVVCLFLLRGPQTPGELRTRSARLHSSEGGFGDNQAVVDVLNNLMGRDSGALIARLPRKAGRMDHEYTHLFYGAIESAPEEESVAHRPASSGISPQQQLHIKQLESRVEALEKALTDLAARLGEDIKLGNDDPENSEVVPGD